MMYYAAELFIIPRYSAIDRDLMHLQRREALHEAVINSAVLAAAHRKKALLRLRDEIDGAWKELYLFRPIS